MSKANWHIKGCGFAVMAKASHPGRTKTRLSPPLSLSEAADFNTAFLCDISDNILKAGESTEITGFMAYGPPGHSDFFQKYLPPQIEIFESWYPTFDQCLISALQTQFHMGYGSACVLNSDSPTLPASILVETAHLLRQPNIDIVLGPSLDGGYYLLGCKQVHQRLFKDISWSTDVVFNETMERAREIDLCVHVLPKWYDVDDSASLKILINEVTENVPFNQNLRSSPAKESTALIKKLCEEKNLLQRLERQRSAQEKLADLQTTVPEAAA